jgi:ubiquinone/menaquinone biosynthesis C-methylase UbiE
MMIGRHQAVAPELSGLERAYVRLVGYPALGLRVRAGVVVPLLRSLPEPKAILDVGCGRGVLTLTAAEMFPAATVVGADVLPFLAERNTEVARRLNRTNARFLATDVTQLDAVEAYDVVLATDVLEHVEDDTDLLRRLLRALRPGGHLVLHVPHVTRHLFGWTRLNFLEIEGHVRPGYTLEGLWRLLNEGGFRVETATYTYNSIETLMNDLSFLITRGRERRKWLYALCFPWLMLVTWLVRGLRPPIGSGLVFVARRPYRSAATGDWPASGAAAA